MKSIEGPGIPDIQTENKHILKDKISYRATLLSKLISSLKKPTSHI